MQNVKFAQNEKRWLCRGNTIILLVTQQFTLYIVAQQIKKQITEINKTVMVKNPHWPEANQLAIYRHVQGVKLGTTQNKSG